VVKSATTTAVGAVSLAGGCGRGVEVEIAAASVENDHLVLGWSANGD
jgi:hypothetical protein